MKTIRKLLVLLITAAFFVCINACLYVTVTRRCRNNFGSAASARMIDAERYVPFTADNALVDAAASLAIEGDLPVLDGATALLPVYAAAAQALYPEDSCPFDGKAYLPSSALQYRNTVGAYRAIVDGDADIIFCAAPSQGQLDYAEEKGISLVFTPIGREAFVFFVNRENPVDGLTTQQVRDIYAGHITSWAEVGGANRLINPVDRREGSGSQSAMLRFMGGEAIRKHPLAFTGASIGFSFRFYMTGIVEDSGVKLLALDGVAPTPENIASGAYPVVSEFFAVTRANEVNPNVQRVVDWLLSDEGRALIEAVGYVPTRLN